MRSTLIVVLGLFFVACGDDGPSGPSSSTPLNTLTEAQATDLCESLVREHSDMIGPRLQFQLECTFLGVEAESESGTSGDCEAARDACIAEREGELEDDINTDLCDDADAHEFDECDEATVGDLRACFRDQTDVLREVMGEISCERLGGDLEAAQAAQAAFIEAATSSNESCEFLTLDCDIEIFGVR